MRLLDVIAQPAHTGVAAAEQPILALGLPSARTYAQALIGCPRRFVLDEDFTRVCTALAFSGGDRLESCLDLIRFPLPQLWVEWPDSAHMAELRRSGFSTSAGEIEGHRAGAWIRADHSGRRGEIHTFWTTRSATDTALAAPVRIQFDLDNGLPPAAGVECAFQGGAFGVSADGFAGMAQILECLRLTFEARWAAYYRSAQLDLEAQTTVLQTSAMSVATNVPMLLAFCLLLNSRAGIRQRPSELERLNRARAKVGKHPLLDHTEVTLPLLERDSRGVGAEGAWRRGPRLHQVRGHLVRRGSVVYWRIPHLRGHQVFGVVRSHTMTLTMGNQ